ncbi:MerR family transcriptional regulator [Streptomyces sp. NPDC000658]|uniref:MerR family transcriptional regulator n=1 Tax=Streptomyces sp. NPDC000658 TaxID=3154266 RepID=UPI0033320EBB
MPLSVSEFSEMCGLPAQTLRFYHAEGLIVPDSVDERTGYRSYGFHQVEQAMLVTTFRQAGLRVQDVRTALADPGLGAAMVEARAKAVSEQRRREDQAIREALSLTRQWPTVRAGRFPGQTVLSTPVPHSDAEACEGHVADERWYDWNRVNRSFDDIVSTLRDAAAAQGFVPTGPAWKAPAVETPQQKADHITPSGPHWLAKLPIGAAGIDVTPLAGELPDRVDVQSWPRHDEIGIRLPGRTTMAKYGTALHRLTTHPLEGLFPDLGRQRLVVHDEATELFLRVLPLTGSDE